eukprot:2419285-Pleurochrysis_carterae.AAC.1
MWMRGQAQCHGQVGFARLVVLLGSNDRLPQKHGQAPTRSPRKKCSAMSALEAAIPAQRVDC